MSDSENYNVKNEVETNNNTGWVAADKEYIGIYSEERCSWDMDFMGNNPGMEMVHLLDISEETDRDRDQGEEG